MQEIVTDLHKSPFGELPKAKGSMGLVFFSGISEQFGFCSKIEDKGMYLS